MNRTRKRSGIFLKRDKGHQRAALVGILPLAYEWVCVGMFPDVTFCFFCFRARGSWLSVWPKHEAIKDNLINRRMKRSGIMHWMVQLDKQEEEALCMKRLFGWRDSLAFWGRPGCCPYLQSVAARAWHLVVCHL
ncbi:uncharacterized protein LOC127750540 [Frankliniella occidentalis]|uniref:Uncharacterized protein LOC127750540 n=1 Tax=Frankliniella occidentalis TaxID=133901 RepID=A0A9C6X3J2_FRAOC|nr:uncharacterized protein LOC127750540 [Frankliniella occidentalis]